MHNTLDYTHSLAGFLKVACYFQSISLIIIVIFQLVQDYFSLLLQSDGASFVGENVLHSFPNFLCLASYVYTLRLKAVPSIASYLI